MLAGHKLRNVQQLRLRALEGVIEITQPLRAELYGGQVVAQATLSSAWHHHPDPATGTVGDLDIAAAWPSAAEPALATGRAGLKWKDLQAAGRTHRLQLVSALASSISLQNPARSCCRTSRWAAVRSGGLTSKGP